MFKLNKAPPVPPPATAPPGLPCPDMRVVSHQADSTVLATNMLKQECSPEYGRADNPSKCRLEERVATSTAVLVVDIDKLRAVLPSVEPARLPRPAGRKPCLRIKESPSAARWTSSAAHVGKNRSSLRRCRLSAKQSAAGRVRHREQLWLSVNTPKQRRPAKER